MPEPLVSVRMITYNHAPYIQEAMEHVLAQRTNFSFELVIGEDCSTDGTRSMVQDFAARHPDRIRLVTAERNVGMAANGRRTDAACRGMYLAYCEGDDFWHRPDKLQRQVDHLERHPGCGLVCSDYDVSVPASGLHVARHRSQARPRPVDRPVIHDILSGRADILTCTVMARRHLVEQVKSDDAFLHRSGHFRMGDTQLWAELSLRAKVFALDDSLATYRVLPESASQSVDPRKRLRFWISNAEMGLYLCRKHRLSSHLRNGYESDWRKKSLMLAFLEQNGALAESVRTQSTRLSLKEWCWYAGAKYRAIRPMVLPLRSLLVSQRHSRQDHGFAALQPHQGLGLS